MNELVSSAFFGLTLTVLAYWVGITIQKKSGLVICNGLVLAALMIIAEPPAAGASPDIAVPAAAVSYLEAL